MKRVSKDIELQICNDYINDQGSSRELGLKYNLAKTTILKILKRNNINPVNKRLVNQELIIDYFEEINCEEKAYLLGFIFADGCVSNDELFIDIHQKDISLLEKFLKIVNSKAKITTRQKQNSMMSRIAIKNREFTQHLKKYGIIENKTQNTNHLPIELIPKKYYKDFLRGLIDGDGWVTKTAEGYYHIGFVTRYYDTAKDFVFMLNTLISEKWNNKIINKNDKYFMVQIQKQSQVKEAAKILYENNNICLPRKFELAQQIYE